MAKKRKPPAAESWASCKRVIGSWPRAGVVALVQELYRLSDDNRRFLHARLLPQRAAQSCEAAAKVIRRVVSPSQIFNDRFRHADVKRVLDQFARATDDRAALAELLLADLAASLASFDKVGDFEPLVDHIYASMERLHKCLGALEPESARPLMQRLDELASQWAGQFGYGVSDELEGLAYEWRERLQT